MPTKAKAITGIGAPTKTNQGNAAPLPISPKLDRIRTATQASVRVNQVAFGALRRGPL